MIKFNKGYNLKIVSITISLSFLFNNIAYAAHISLRENTLRVPFDEKRSRVKEAEESVASNKNLTRRKFIKKSVLATAAAGVLVSIYKAKTTYDTVNYFSFDNAKIYPGKQEGADAQNLANELNLIKTEKLSESEVIAQCAKLSSRIIRLNMGNKATYESIIAIIPELVFFLTAEDVNGINSVSAKWEMNLVKIRVIYLLFAILRNPETPTKMAKVLLKTLGELVEYIDNFSEPDSLYMEYFPGVNPTEVLSSRIKILSYNILQAIS